MISVVPIIGSAIGISKIYRFIIQIILYILFIIEPNTCNCNKLGISTIGDDVCQSPLSLSVVVLNSRD